jgi:hypothetical protein
MRARSMRWAEWREARRSADEILGYDERGISQ